MQIHCRMKGDEAGLENGASVGESAGDTLTPHLKGQIQPHHDNDQLPIGLTETMAIFLAFWSSETLTTEQRQSILPW